MREKYPHIQKNYSDIDDGSGISMPSSFMGSGIKVLQQQTHEDIEAFLNQNELSNLPASSVETKN